MLVPKGWTLERFLDQSAQAQELDDYGIILRCTRQAGDKIVFVCAGFTENGTYQAGKFLARRWEKLQAEANAGENRFLGCGDFLAIIAGQSRDRELWALELFFTPKHLVDWVAERDVKVPLDMRAPHPYWVTRWLSRQQELVRAG